MEDFLKTCTIYHQVEQQWKTKKFNQRYKKEKNALEKIDVFCFSIA